MDETCFFFIVFRIFYCFPRNANGNNRCNDEWTLTKYHDTTVLYTEAGNKREIFKENREREREREDCL